MQQSVILRPNVKENRAAVPMTHLHIWNSVFVFMHWQIGFSHCGEWGGVRHLVGSWIIKHNLNCAVTRPMSICFLNMLKIHFRWIPHHADDGSSTSWTRAFHAHHCLLLNSQSTVITILQDAAGKLFRIIIFYHHPSSFTVMASPEGVLCPAANSSHFFVMNGIVSLNVPQLLHCIQIDRFYRCRGTI